MVADRSQEVLLIVEGGGDRNRALGAECRRAFTRLLERSGLKGRKPRTIPAGGRKSAYDEMVLRWDDFRRGAGPLPLLLVDSEGPVHASSPWAHVAGREGDRWSCPAGAGEEHLHLMVECMEAWLVADRAALKAFFGKDFRESALPSETTKIETVAKAKLYDALERASRPTSKGVYGKGAHSFKLLETVDVAKIRVASPWADRFFSTLDRLSRSA